MNNFLEPYAQLFDKHLKNIQWNSKPAGLYEPLSYFLQLGGKRTRPLLTLMSTELFGTNPEISLPAATAVEYFHNFSLIHDDVMDQAPLRRNHPTVHIKWDLNTSILSGDVLLIKAYQEIAKQDKEVVADLLNLFNDTAVWVCEGQQMDMNFETQNEVSISDYLEMIRLKTSVLLGCALQMGAIVAKANSKEQADLFKFGELMGIAFQIQDDILDAYGDPESFGKQVGGDIFANKKTLLYLLCLKKGNVDQKKYFLSIMSSHDMDTKVFRIKEVYDQLDVRKEAEKMMLNYHDQAISLLDSLGVDRDKKEPLFQLADFLIKRTV